MDLCNCRYTMSLAFTGARCISIPVLQQLPTSISQVLASRWRSTYNTQKAGVWLILRSRPRILRAGVIALLDFDLMYYLTVAWVFRTKWQPLIAILSLCWQWFFFSWTEVCNSERHFLNSLMYNDSRLGCSVLLFAVLKLVTWSMRMR